MAKIKRDHKNYGGKTRNVVNSTGTEVTNFAAPTRMAIREDGGELSFNFLFQRWEDVSDFDDNKPAIAAFDAPVNSQSFDVSEIAAQYSAVLGSIKNGTLEFFGVSGEDFKFFGIQIDSLNFSIFVEARHKTRDKYTLNDSVQGVDDFEATKLVYLNSIVLPLFGMAWGVGASDRNLAKFG